MIQAKNRLGIFLHEVKLRNCFGNIEILIKDSAIILGLGRNGFATKAIFKPTKAPYPELLLVFGFRDLIVDLLGNNVGPVKN